MAIVDKRGNISGKLNGRIYYIINGKQYVRNAPAHITNPCTPGQLAQRQKQTLATHFAKKLKHLIKIGYQQSRMETSRHEFISHLIRETIRGSYPDQYIDYSKVRVSRGKIDKPNSLSLERIGNGLILSWKEDLRHAEAQRSDKLVLLLINDAGDIFIDFNLASREDETATLELPAGFTETTHVWVFYHNPDKFTTERKEKVSESVYLGEI